MTVAGRCCWSLSVSNMTARLGRLVCRTRSTRSWLATKLCNSCSNDRQPCSVSMPPPPPQGGDHRLRLRRRLMCERRRVSSHCLAEAARTKQASMHRHASRSWAVVANTMPRMETPIVSPDLLPSPPPLGVAPTNQLCQKVVGGLGKMRRARAYLTEPRLTGGWDPHLRARVARSQPCNTLERLETPCSVPGDAFATNAPSCLARSLVPRRPL